ncbi:MAG: tetratricopeptide repeat protein, partial [Gammaproteobacteria bacterium]
MDQPISKVDLPATQRDLIEQALVHFDAKEFGQARTVSDKLLQLAPQDYSALHLAGVVATAQNRLPEASEFLKRALKRAPDAIKASVSWFALGKALQGAHDLRQAQEAFRRAIRLNPGVCSYYIELADVYADEWKLDLAIETLKTAINRFPTDAVPCAALGNVLHQYGRQSDALIAYELAVKRQPDYADARLSIGSMLKALGRFKEAEAETLEALQFDPMCRAYSQLAQFRKFGPDAPEIDKIKKRLDPEANAPDAARVDALYALSK